MTHYLTEAYEAGKAVCDAFSAAVLKAGYKSRWDRIDWDRHPELKAARDAHHAASKALGEAFARQREEQRLHSAGRTKAGNDISGI
jgi:hypothetical protein